MRYILFRLFNNSIRRCSYSTSATLRKQKTRLDIDNFGSYEDECGKSVCVKRFTWTNCNNVAIQVINWGATIISIKIPDRHGKVEDIALGLETLEEYLGPKHQNFGATLGRVANRIAMGKMTVEGVEHSLSINEGASHLHGGFKGFKVKWHDYVTHGNKVIMTYLSKDLEEGYPGDLLATVSFKLNDDNEFEINYKATVTKPCPVNMTNHCYFNLAGHGAGPTELYKHEITINADRYAEVDPKHWLPTGKLRAVSGTEFDLRVPTVLGNVINKVPGAPLGYDHNFCITRGSSQALTFAAKAFHPSSGRIMEVYSNQPGLQFYTSSNMPQDGSITGKGVTYCKHSGFCLETQKYPNAVHQPKFPNVILYPGEEYHHTAIFKFLVQE